MAKVKNDFGGLMPFGFQDVPGSGRGEGFSSLFYNMGMPGLYNGRFTSIYSDQFNNALMNGKDPNSIMPWGRQSRGSSRSQPQAAPQEAEPSIQWTFPQYSQSWAFAPPVAPPYVMPPPFDKKQYK